MAAMGSPDPRQIDGLGGADPLTSKVAVVGRSTIDGVDLDYLFCQVGIEDPFVDVTPNCGNMLAGVLPFAIENGLLQAQNGTTRAKIRMVNSGNLCEVRINTPNGVVTYDGEARIDGVPGTASPVMIDFLDTAGSACGALLPTGNILDTLDGVEATCIDNGMPVVLLRATDVGATGYETRDQLNAATDIKTRIEKLRLISGEAMRLGDVSGRVVPKMCLISSPAGNGALNTRCLIPHVCHASIGVLAAVTVATACVLPGSVADGIARMPGGNPCLVSIEHPSGEFTVELETARSDEGTVTVNRSGLLRTTRRLMEGNALIPSTIWDGSPT